MKQKSIKKQIEHGEINVFVVRMQRGNTEINAMQ